MGLKGKKIGIAVTGSHCTLSRVSAAVKYMSVDEGALIYPIFSDNVRKSSNRFGNSDKWYEEFSKYSEGNIIDTIEDAEPIGPNNSLDIMVIAPCTGNTLAKLATGIIDTPVLMAVKAHLRNNKPVVIAISTNDALGINGKNIGSLLNAKNIYWVPFGQDDPQKKPNSLVARMDLLPETINHALEAKQIQPLIVEY